MDYMTCVNKQKWMTSKEIAELTGKLHKNVMRDIRSLIEQGAIGQLNFEPVKYCDTKGEMRPMYSLDFRATMTVITGYDAKRRAKVVKRWIALENGTAAPANQSRQTYAEALRALADEVEQQESKFEPVSYKGL
jgi:Rha family phage regulatory protein